MKKIITAMCFVLIALLVSCSNSNSEEKQFKDAAEYMLYETKAVLPENEREDFQSNIDSIKEETAEAEDVEGAKEAFSDALFTMLLYLLDDEESCKDILRKVVKKYPKTESYLRSL